MADSEDPYQTNLQEPFDLGMYHLLTLCFSFLLFSRENKITYKVSHLKRFIYLSSEGKHS